MSRRINLIPMAGEGRRFLDAGYRVPKPLIEISGKPMIIRAANCLPSADRWVFVCRTEHIEKAGIDNVLKNEFEGAEIVPVEELTQGQACTCLLARELWDDDDILTIGPCDNAMTYDADGLKSALEDGVDALVWTFRNNPAVLQDPRMYGWVDVDEEGTARKISCKMPISDDPVNDHAIIGAFTFRRAGDFAACADSMIAADRRIRNEFYVDEVMNVAVEEGLKVKVFEVDRYICWGTPADVEAYEYWRSYFVRAGL